VKEDRVVEPFEITNANREPGRNIARTMGLLATSTEAHPNEVRVLVYGQSISKQLWWLKVKHWLQATYPHAKLVMENWAIGGFHATRLLACAEHDVRLFYPDLVLFHDYGPQDDYEAIIRAIRRTTTAEIAIQTDHVAVGQNEGWHDAHAFEWLPALCDRYGLELVDVRRNWQRHLAQTGLAAQDLLSDHVHLNDAGNALMAAIVSAHLVQSAAYGPDPQGLTSLLRLGVDFVPGSEITVAFDGNRVDLIDAARLDAAVLIDGQPPSAHGGSYVAERPWLDRSWPPKVGVPVRIDLGERPESDRWSLRVREVLDDGAEVRFELHSERHGFDGAGTSAADFVSQSGRIVIPRTAWFVREETGFFAMLPAVGVDERIPFAVRLLGRDRVAWAASPAAPVTLAQVAERGAHRLTLRARNGGGLPVRALRVHRSPL